MSPTELKQSSTGDSGSLTQGSHWLDGRIRWIVVVVGIWGLLLTIGATGWAVGLFDLRRSAIVLFCFVGFLGFWLGMLATRQRSRLADARREGAEDSEPVGTGDDVADRRPAAAQIHRPYSVSAMVSLAAAVAGLAIWGAAIYIWPASRWTAVVLGWTTGLFLCVGGVAALVSLSDPRPVRGRVWAVPGAIAALLAVAGMFWRAW